MRALFVASFGFAVVACAADRPPVVVVPPEPPVDVAIGNPEPAPPPPPEPVVDVPPRPDDETETIALTGVWAATFGHTLKFDDAVHATYPIRSAYLAASRPIFESDGGVPSAADFQKANALVDQLNRRYAAAYFAPDATAEQRLQILDEASSTLLQWSRRLDEVGLAQTPASYKTNGAIAMTFEEVVQGPAKRWRSEGFTLASLCHQRATEADSKTPAAKHCAETAKTYAHVAAKNPPKTKAPAECACNPGDPLCSATMSGWCKPK